MTGDYYFTALHPPTPASIMPLRKKRKYHNCMKVCFIVYFVYPKALYYMRFRQRVLQIFLVFLNMRWRPPMPLICGQIQHGDSTSYSSTIVHCVQSLYINRYICSNKLVLSKLLSCLLLLQSGDPDSGCTSCTVCHRKKVPIANKETLLLRIPSGI